MALSPVTRPEKRHLRSKAFQILRHLSSVDRVSSIVRIFRNIGMQQQPSRTPMADNSHYSRTIFFQMIPETVQILATSMADWWD